MGVRAFLDRSGSRGFATLAAFAGNDLTWADFEGGWNQILDSAHPYRVPYFHVVEALNCRYKTPFCRTLGWTREDGFALLQRLVVYMGQFNRGLLTMHSCVVDMEAWRYLTGNGCEIPSEIELCNKYVSQYIVARFAEKAVSEAGSSPTIVRRREDLLSFVFDRNEPFREPFGQFIKQEKEKAKELGVNSIWQFVDGVGEADMETVPGIQAADIFAWGINREKTVAESEDGKHIAYLLRQVVMSSAKEYDRATLLREFGPPLPHVYL